MATSNDIRNKRRLAELSVVRAGFVLRFSFTTLRQVESHAR
jgi:hypothetical protein